MSASLAAAWRTTPRLEGGHAVLEPLQPAHAAGLQAALRGSGLEGLWYTNVPAPEQVADYVQSALRAHAAGQAMPFAVRDAAGAVVGSTRFYRLDPAVPTLCIGYTWYAPRVQRTGVNTECKWLLLRHAFETLGCISVVFETSSHNARSRAAISRLGARQDGVLRNHKRHADGSPRDTVVFSIIDSEWPAVDRGLRARLQAHGTSP